MSAFTIGLLSFFLIMPAWASEDPQACFTVIAGTKATNDGSVMVAHNEDDGGVFQVNVFKVPASARRTGDSGLPVIAGDSLRSRNPHGFLWLEVPGQEFADAYIGENGLIVTSNACRSREDRSDLSGSGIGYLLGRLVIERAGTAREAVKLAGSLIEQYGYSSSGRNYVFADAQEGWFFHAVRGRHWVAQRIPDNEVALIANYYRIGAIDLRDPQRFLASPELVEYAIKRGWYHPERDGEFHFAKTYSDPDTLIAAGNTERQWRGTVLLGNKSLKLGEPLPFSFEPRHKLKPADLFRLLRDHYEDTGLDLTDGYRKGTPHATPHRTICTRTTQYAFVAQLRSSLPADIGPLFWLAFRHPCLHAFTPWYPAIDDVPRGFGAGDSESALSGHLKPAGTVPPFAGGSLAFAVFDRISEVVDARYAELNRATAKVWRNLESFALKELSRKEKEFVYLLGIDRSVGRHLVSHHVHGLAYHNWILARDLLNELEGRPALRTP